ncbi:MAG TPA: hypothetical protein VI583_13890, partial [Cyclobacteriaceae bacterium]|nr:hypothetical protein [Cyclobacteriaceae bacterium]
MRLFSLSIFLSVNFLVQGCYTLADKKPLTSPEFVLTASTPGDSLILSMLNIDITTKVDFIRWELLLTDNHSGTDSFSLHINYGIGQPNTLGFINGGQQASLHGSFSILLKNGAEIFWFTGFNPAITFSLIKINENLYHLLTPELKLMVGNGGWSYTLNRKEPKVDKIQPSTVFSSESGIAFSKLIYAGRAPCNKLADLYDLGVSRECIKLKWKLT